MDKKLTITSKELTRYAKSLTKLKELIISNILILGQEPAKISTLKDDDVRLADRSPRSVLFAERLSTLPSVDECTVDDFGNPVAVLKGANPEKKPIVIAAHMDIFQEDEEDLNLSVTKDSIVGPGVADNSVSVGVLASLPEIFDALDMRFESDIYLLGFCESLGNKNLRSARNFLANWHEPMKAAVMLEGVEIGRLNYYSLGMVGSEITVEIPGLTGWEHAGATNAIIILNEVINRIMSIRIPQRPMCRIVIGRMEAGMKRGDAALFGAVGFEIVSDSMEMVKDIYAQVQNIVEGLSYEHQVAIRINRFGDSGAFNLGYDHPLVKGAIKVMEKLKIEPKIASSESELALFLERGIPSITIGLTHGDNRHKKDARIKLNPLYTGVAQLLGILQIIDKGLDDE